MKTSFFSILIPAKGRPKYLAEAIESVLLQDFQDMELVISNNGADKALREVAIKYLGDIRIRYVEQPEVLNMPAHWEKVTQDLVGEYVLVLTDRSLLKAGTLQYLYQQIMQMEKLPDVISWAWDIYYDDLKVLLQYSGKERKPKMLDSDSQLIEIAHGIHQYPYFLPRGLNSCVRNEFIRDIREKYGQAFRPLSPDFTFAYLCLLQTKYFAYIDASLFVSQGLKVSNGGNSSTGDMTPYMKSLGLENPFKHVPHKLLLVQNALHEDFLAMASLCGRKDILRLWSKSNYYVECFAEIDEKREAGLLPTSIVDKMEQDITNALTSEPLEIREEVSQTRTLTKRICIRVVGTIKRLLGSRLENIRRFVLLRKRGGVVCQTALEAAGFEARK